ncbi:Insulinase (Peptidase M16), partial [Ascosphaera pollenicola]
YPQENAYSQYLSANSGYSNAYTASCDTNYYFEVAAGSNELPTEASQADAEALKQKSPLYGALDRFAQFFIAPLFLRETLDRELHAVDSENKKNLQSDPWRLSQLAKALASPKHPYHKFSTGNLQTLRDEPKKMGIEIRDEFMKFHEEQYSANRMRLVVLGREPLDVLESWVAELFSGISNKDLPRNRWDGSPYTSTELNKQVFAKPVMDSRSLEITIPFPDEEHLYESQPSHYISHLIGHEGPGSILSYIKEKGWAHELSAGSYTVSPGSALFMINVRLTEEGLERYHDIVRIIFEYIALIKEHPPEKWIFDEMASLSEVDFKYMQKVPAARFASKMSSTMQKPLKPEHLMSGSFLLKHFDAEAIIHGLSHLRPDNFNMMITSQKLPCILDKREKWYGTEYHIEDIPKGLTEELTQILKSPTARSSSELHLPHRNEFVPTRFDVEKKEVDKPVQQPALIRHDDKVRTWFKKDDTFWVPKAAVELTLRSPLVYATPANNVMTRLYCELVRDALTEYSYDAELAGLTYSLWPSNFGIEISVSGYNDKLSVLLQKVLATMKDIKIRTDRFGVIKERMARGFKNAEYQQPYLQVSTYLRYLIHEHSWVNRQYAAELEHITASDVEAFFPQVLRQMHVELLVHGNMYKEDALRITDMVEDTVKTRALPRSQWPTQRNLILAPGSDHIYECTLEDPDNVNHCIDYYLQVSEKSNKKLCAKLLLFDQMTSEPAFDQLRTQEQLGYVVFSGTRALTTTVGYYVRIQSERDNAYLESRIDKFLADFSQKLTNMSDKEFEDHKLSVINKRLEKLKNLGLETRRFWTHIGSEYYDFLQHEEDAAHVRALTKQAMIDFYRQYIDPASNTRAKLSIHMVARGKAEQTKGSDETQEATVSDKSVAKGDKSTAAYITTVPDFKARQALTASPSPIVDLSYFEELASKL